MTKVRTTSDAACLVLLLALSVPAALADRSTGETIDDSTVASSVKMSLVEDDAAPAGDINIEAYKGTVQLIGFVKTDAEKAAAIELAKGVDGVTTVVDAMIVVPEKRSFGTTIDDQTIQTKVKYGIGEVGAEEGLAVVTDVRNGEVLLGGFVNSERVRDDIVKKAEAVEGVTKVHNFIGVKG
jgi:osmotically-inducible protein OsmY